MDTVAKVRFRRSVGKESISSIARELNLSRPTVRKHCRTQIEPIYRRAQQPTPMLGAFQDGLPITAISWKPGMIPSGSSKEKNSRK
jgi:predicted transcriptional regulator